MDVEELKNHAGDRTWHEMTKKIMFIDEIIRTIDISLLSEFKKSFSEDCKYLVVYPNCHDKESSNESECVIKEKCIVEEAQKIVVKRHKRDEEYLFMETHMRA